MTDKYNVRKLPPVENLRNKLHYGVDYLNYVLYYLLYP